MVTQAVLIMVLLGHAAAVWAILSVAHMGEVEPDECGRSDSATAADAGRRFLFCSPTDRFPPAADHRTGLPALRLPSSTFGLLQRSLSFPRHGFPRGSRLV